MLEPINSGTSYNKDLINKEILSKIIMVKETITKAVADSSIITGGILSKRIQSKEISVSELIIPEAFISVFEHMAGNEKAVGFIGLDELKELRDILGDKLHFKGKRPTEYEIKYLNLIGLDSLARQLAFDEGAMLITTSDTKANTAEANGIKSLLITAEKESVITKLEKLFDETTMSVHLKESLIPYAKKGKPGEWKFMPIQKEPLSKKEIKEISQEIIESPRLRDDAFIEIERTGSTIVQMGLFRTVITRPPFSDGWEITASRPIRKLDFKEYNMSPELKERIMHEASGLVIAGAPGSGKTTFASALAEFYASMDKIVKTIEAPRDMILGPKITQYAISHGDAQEIHDILLLSRPDYSVFDEMRNTSDFELFIDLRLAGIGLAGVIHATKPIDAVQRFITRTELGVIPQVIDTLIFIDKGQIGKVLSINMAVKVPTGMTEADLARPVVEVKDFETKQLEYEMYTYGEQTVMIPVIGISQKKSGMNNLAVRQIENAFSNLTDSAEAEMVSQHKAIVYVADKDLPRIIGKQGKNIEQIEKELGIRIQLEPIQSKSRPNQKAIKYNLKERGNYIIFNTDRGGDSIDTFVDDAYLFTSTTSKKGEIKINKKSQLGKSLIKALDLNKKIDLKVSA